MAIVGGGRSGDEAIHAEGLLVEEHRVLEAQGGVELVPVTGGAERHRIDSQGLEQPPGDGAVGPGAVDHQGPAVEQMQLAAQVELVALGVAAEVVVVVQDEDPRVWLGRPIEVGRRKPADPGADDDEIVGLAGVLGRAAA